MPSGDKAARDFSVVEELGTREREDRGPQESDEDHRRHDSSSDDLHSRMFSS